LKSLLRTLPFLDLFGKTEKDVEFLEKVLITSRKGGVFPHYSKSPHVQIVLVKGKKMPFGS